jgi:thiol-disulfide isomerase/thioredoxin
VRTLFGVALVTVCLGLAGCSLFGKKPNAQPSNAKPFLGSETPARPEKFVPSDTAGGPPPGASGLLAGQVVDTSTGRPVKAAIEVKDLEDDAAKVAAIDYETKEDGYFTILGVKPGHHYRLIARSQTGGGLASGTVFVIPPKPSLYIRINRQFTTPSTPAVPAPPSLPGKKPAPSADSAKEGNSATGLGTPIKIKDPPPPPSGGMGANQDGNPPNISNVANGFNRMTPPLAEIPGPGQYHTTPLPPPPPQWESMPEDRQPKSEPPPIVPSTPSPSVRLPARSPRVPSCVLLGNKLDNFALNDLNGQPWEYRRDRQGRVVLLSFWFSTCPACKHAMPHLTELQRKYGPYKLEVIGIACEKGNVEEYVPILRGVCARYHLNYRTLLGGSHDTSPVVQQFGVQRYPTLILLDDSGKIVWSNHDGMYENDWRTLEQEIAKRLIQRR